MSKNLSAKYYQENKKKKDYKEKYRENLILKSYFPKYKKVPFPEV